MSKFVILSVEGVMQDMIKEGFISDSVQGVCISDVITGTQHVC